AAGLVLASALYTGLTRWSQHRRWPRANLALPAMAAILGFGLVVGGNYAFTKHIFISRAGPVFMFARMLQDGLVKQVLDETCPSSHLVLCHYRRVLPSRADDWLWGPGTPFVTMPRFRSE